MEVEREAKVVDDSVIGEYVRRFGQILVRKSDGNVPFIIKAPGAVAANPLAPPGVFFFINRALVLKAGPEAELAAVTGHEKLTSRPRMSFPRRVEMRSGQIGRIAPSIAIPYGSTCFLHNHRTLELKIDPTRITVGQPPGWFFNGRCA